MYETRKNAFTLPEILIVIVIIAIAATLMMTTLKPSANQHVLKKLYYNAYRSLSTAAFNIQADVEDKNNKRREEIESTGVDPFPGNPMEKFPTSTYSLCNRLSDKKDGYINVSGITKCEATVSPGDVTQFKGKNDYQLQQMASFTASNGMLYFIAATPGDDADYESDSFVVWVDLNGPRQPNSAEWNEHNLPDIVPFFVSTSGVVVPMGYPIWDSRYLTARVTYSNPDIVKDSKIMSYGLARAAAFHGLPYELDPMSYRGPNLLFTYATILKNSKGITTEDDPDCPQRNLNEFPACSVKVEPQDANWR